MDSGERTDEIQLAGTGLLKLQQANDVTYIASLTEKIGVTIQELHNLRVSFVQMILY